MRKQLHLACLAGVSVFAATIFACGGGGDDNGGGPDANGLPDGWTILPDGAIIGPDGEVITDAGMNPGLDVNLPDGFTSPDGNSEGGMSMADGGCSPPGITCSGQNPVFANTCDMNGNLTSVNCTAQGKLCAAGYGCVVCQPGAGSCNGNTATRCLPDGTGWTMDYCDPLMGLTCNQGVCTGVCANIGQSYIGCEYYAVTMSNPWLDQTTFPFAISVSNTSQQTASVNIQGPGNYNQTINVNAGAVITQTLPWVNALSTTWITARANAGAYHIRSTQPITVYQFNPRDYVGGGTNSYTNDASLLLPVNAMTGNYLITSWPTWEWSSGQQAQGLLTIIGTQANTTVKFTTAQSGPVQAGQGIAANGASTVTLGAGDVLQIASAANAGGALQYGTDPSGATVAADKPVEVFGGSACTFIPANVGYCDHIEEVIFPQETLRTDYLVVPPNNTVAAPRNYVKIVATTNGTTLTYNPNVGGPASLNAGQVGTFLTQTPFRVTANANHPIIVGAYMLGEDNFGTNQFSGDPAMSAAVAMEQYRTGYSFFSPPNYAQNWVTVTAAMGTAVTVDGNAVGALTQIGNSGYGYKYVSLCANNSCTGVHSAASNAQFGIQVYGYGSYTSYWYPGGLDLKR